jgi:hypothetical protein
MLQTEVVQKIKTHILSSIITFGKFRRFGNNVEKYCRTGQATEENMAHARCMLDT